MPLVSFKELMANAERGGYAVGYFESWDLQSLQAVAAAAEGTRSPVILGFGGLDWPSPACPSSAHLDVYAGMARAAGRELSVPACLIFNESPHLDWVLKAVASGFGIVMFADDDMPPDEQINAIRQVVQQARLAGVAVEGEVGSPPGLNDDLSAVPEDRRCTEPETAVAFVERTGVDALAVNVGQVHLHGRTRVGLDFGRLQELLEAVSVPLVLHGASSIRQADLTEAVRLGVRKVNVGSSLKRAYFEALRIACAGVGDDYNPYRVLGSGTSDDVLDTARKAMQETVEQFMTLFGSAGRA